jgi:uncharacterized protein
MGTGNRSSAISSIQASDMREIYRIRYGSHTYGTNTEDSDEDIRVILLPTVEQSLSLENVQDFDHVTMKDDKDYVAYSLQKFCRLAGKGNPSVLEWFFVPENCIQNITPEMKRLRDNRDLFVTRSVYNRFRGYALSEYKKLTKMGGNKGEKRKEEIRKYGYSPKNAMNMLRLMEQGVELLETGQIKFPRPNAGDLLKIKRGEVSLQTIERKYAELEKKLDDAYEKSTLPEKPDWDKINKLMTGILIGNWGWNSGSP